MSKWFYVKLAVLFGALSALTYYAHFLIFHDVHHIFIYLVGDLGFMFLEVLLITLVFHELLSRREKRFVEDPSLILFVFHDAFLPMTNLFEFRPIDLPCVFLPDATCF